MRIIHVPPRHVACCALLALAVLLLSSCQSLGSARVPPSIDRANALEQRGDHAGAAREFEAIAAQNPGTAGVAYLLRAAREYIAAQRTNDAQRLLDAAMAAPGSADALEASSLRVELALLRGQTQQAWAALTEIHEPADRAARLRYLALRQRTAIAAARPVEGIRAQMAREKLLDTDQARANSRRELLTQLRAAAQQGVRLDPAGARDTVVRGWLELGLLASQSDRATLGTPLANWRARYPGHPGSALARGGLILGNADNTSGRVSSEPGTISASAHVAVLLPLTGRTAAAAAQIRDGLLTALYTLPAGARPELRFYDTNSMSVGDAIATASAAGAQAIIGPLLREEVIAAAQYSGRRPPLLALNYLPVETPAPANFYQYALSPENEARQVARRALADGRRRAVVLVPEGDWGSRVLAAFRQELEAGGGRVLADVTYDPERNDFSAPIQQVLRLSDSIARERRLQNVLGTSLQFTPRRRGDIDFLFIPATASVVRQLRPQLRFYYAGDIPTYSTSDSYDGTLQANQDLDGLMFPDMPWVLAPADSGSASDVVSRARAAAQQAWGDAAPRGRLFAFGYDAWQLTTAIESGSAAASGTVLAGLTGELSFDAEHRIHRDLNWAQIRGGNLRLLPRANGP